MSNKSSTPAKIRQDARMILYESREFFGHLWRGWSVLSNFLGTVCPEEEHSGQLRNGKRAAYNYRVIDARGRLLSTREA